MDKEFDSKIHWWGYCSGRGWVFLDRTIPSNGPGRNDDLLFLDCTTETVFYVKRSSWCQPDFVASKVYLSSISFEAREIEQRYLEGFKTRILGYKNITSSSLGYKELLHQHKGGSHNAQQGVKTETRMDSVGGKVSGGATAEIAILATSNVQDKSSAPYLKIAFFAFAIVCIFFWMNRDKPCSEAYADAWKKCNADYNGKCRYLGPKYKPKSCIPEYPD